MAKKFELKIISEKEKQQLEELLMQLKSVRGRHTELVTVYIPSGFNKDQIVRQLEYEKSTAANIKSKQTRSAVEASLDSLTRELKSLKQTPPNGLACFSGNVSEKEGQQDIKTWLYEPPKALNIRLYRCDQVFITEYLEQILNTAEVYALLVMDRREATIGILEGKKIELIRTLTSNVPGKIRAGGQSAARYERITEDLAKDVPGVDVYGNIGYGDYTFISEYTTAATKFSSDDMTFDGQAAQPQALDLQAVYEFTHCNRPSFLALDYGQSWQALALGVPKRNVGTTYGISIWEHTIVSLELMHNWGYGTGSTATGSGIAVDTAQVGQTYNSATLQLDMYF